MAKILVYVLFAGLVLYFLSVWAPKQKEGPNGSLPKPGGGGGKGRKWLRTKKDPSETWVQVYETVSMEEAKAMRARMQEEEIECVVYEQGKKSIDGSAPKGVGLAVPKSAVAFAQGIIARMTS